MNDFDFLNESLRQMDKELQTQKELNELADILTRKLREKVNSGDRIDFEYNDIKLSLVSTYDPKYRIFKIYLIDVDKFNMYNSGQLITGKMYTPTIAKFEIDEQESIDHQIHDALTLTLFKKFGIEISPTAEDDGVVSI